VLRKEKTLYFVRTGGGDFCDIDEKTKIMQLSRFCQVMDMNYGSIVIRINRMNKEEKKKMIVDNVMYIPSQHYLLDNVDKRTLRKSKDEC
jgi:hypothetical protein